jgi:hypothetical protein
MRFLMHFATGPSRLDLRLRLIPATFELVLLVVLLLLVVVGESRSARKNGVRPLRSMVRLRCYLMLIRSHLNDQVKLRAPRLERYVRIGHVILTTHKNLQMSQIRGD